MFLLFVDEITMTRSRKRKLIWLDTLLSHRFVIVGVDVVDAVGAVASVL